ncbi:MAG: integrase core domain-containing protein [Candidatus Aminicenantales bacterium]
MGEAASSLELKLAAAPPQLPLSLYLIDNIRNALARPHLLTRQASLHPDKARGLLLEPENVRRAKLARKRRRKPRYATRMPRGYRVEAPGDLVEVDTLRVSLLRAEKRFHFSAWDRFTRLVGMKAYKRQTSIAATDFLYHLKTKFPFPRKAIQIDGGSESMDQFEAACQRVGILLFQNPPAQPELNGGVERNNRTHREEFYEVQDVSLNLEEHNQQLARYEYDHNYIRPHWALEPQTPFQYYLHGRKFRKLMCHQCPELIQRLDKLFFLSLSKKDKKGPFMGKFNIIIERALSLSLIAIIGILQCFWPTKMGILSETFVIKAELGKNLRPAF